MSLEEKLETYLKEKYANDEKTTKNSEADIPDFRAGFLEIPEEDRRRMEKDKLDWRQLESRTRWFNRRRQIVEHCEKHEIQAGRWKF